MIAFAKYIAAAVVGLFTQGDAGAEAAHTGASPTAVSVQASAYQPRILSASDQSLFRDALAAARARDVMQTESLRARIENPTARKLIRWALIDTAGAQLSLAELESSITDFADWPRGDSRQNDLERAMDRAGVNSSHVLTLYASREPQTMEGAMALASALESNGQSDEARTLIRRWWREQSFELAVQERALGRYGRWLTQADHDARLDMLLLGPQGPAARAMIALASPDHRALANARMALRGGTGDIEGTIASVPASLMNHPGLAIERVRLLRQRNRGFEAYALLAQLPPAPSHSEGQNLLWTERRNFFLDALQARNWQGAYDAMAGHGFPSGERRVDAEFFAGWVALTKLNDPVRAGRHFEALRQSSTTPITQGRAHYWLGRVADAQQNAALAQRHYEEGARHIQSFYGQLSAERAGIRTITLPPEPAPTAADVARFEGRETIQAARILAEMGEMSLFRVFVLHIDDWLPGPEELALLMDMARGYNETFTAMMVGRAASQRGYLIPERAYPIRTPQPVSGAAPVAFTLAITRQESSFDPRARSHADARGMMQFLPSTAQGVARRMGLPYSAEMLWDPEYNMQLGSYHLGELMSQNGGSYLLAAVGYNAGPARSPQWVSRCGDPRAAQTDPIDFIECVPFTETRNYMMRVMENMQVYRARLNGGTAPLTLSQDLAAGGGPVAYDAVAGGR